MTLNPMKLFRWKYLLPRLAILLILGLIVRYGLDPTLKWALVTGGESAVGAKVDVGELTTSLVDGQLVVKKLAIVNPQSPMKNILEATDSTMQLDMNALLHGRVVVTDGLVSGLQFDTDRESSGALAKTASDTDTGPSVFDPLLARADAMGEQWLNDLSDRLSVDVVDQLKSPMLAKQLQDRWPQQYEGLRQQVDSIRAQGKQLEAEIKAIKANPLRGLEKLPALQQQVTQLQQEVKLVQQQIGNLPKQAEADRQAVLAARQQDEQFIRQQLQFDTLDGEGLTQTLLGKPVNDGLVTALGWIRWARDQIPAGSNDLKEHRGRGTTVVFTPPQPDYLVEQLQIEGSASVNGKSLQLTGMLTGVSDAPQLLDEPARLQLSGSDALQWNVNIEIDRRDDTARDKLLLICPEWGMAQRTLGNADKLAIEMGEGVAQFKVELDLRGDELSGEVLFAQESLELTPRLAKSPSKNLSAVLDGALAGVQRLEAKVSLTGTLEKPKVTIASDIGNQVAAGFNASVKSLVQNRADGLLAKSREQVDAQLAKLTKLREQAQQELLGQLGEGQELLGQLAALSGGGKGLGLPAGIPQLGKSLRPENLLK